MKVLSVRQPWASLIVFGVDGVLKDIENRQWPAPPKLIGERIGIHASKTVTRDEVEDAVDFCRAIGLKLPQGFIDDALKLHAGKILGTVRLVDCVQRHNSRWFQGRYGFVLRASKPLETPIQAKGQLGFWDFELQDDGAE